MSIVMAVVRPVAALAGLLALAAVGASPALATVDVTYEYDANGNMTRDGATYYEYNDANQLVRVRDGSATGPILAEYTYDHTGQRVKKVEGGVTRYYIGKHYVGVHDGSVETGNNWYFVPGDRVAVRDDGGALQFTLSDHLKNTDLVVDDLAGVRADLSYFPYGENRGQQTYDYMYTGKEYDSVTRSYYFENRFYSPGRFQFTQADLAPPDLDDPQFLNRYSYVTDNPIRYIDPNGHVRWDTLGESFNNLGQAAGLTATTVGSAFLAGGIWGTMRATGFSAKALAKGGSSYVSALTSFNDASKQGAAALSNFVLAFQEKDAISSRKFKGIFGELIKDDVRNSRASELALAANQFVSLFLSMDKTAGLNPQQLEALSPVLQGPLFRFYGMTSLGKKLGEVFGRKQDADLYHDYIFPALKGAK